MRVRRVLTATHGGSVLACACDRSSRFFASGSVDHSVAMWSLDRKDAYPKLWEGRHGAYVQDVQFSSDSLLLASVGGDRICRVWDVETGTTTHILRTSGALTLVRFSPCCKRVMAGGL
ncbi:hypothetical protein GUITHDRAFT_76661, partial [Guillardia theta CCMP2712]